MTILMVGLNGAGKTTIATKLITDENINTVPTVGFAIENYEYKYFRFWLSDLGGQDKMRPLFKHFFASSDALIFVVDSSDDETIELCKYEFNLLRVAE